MNTQDAKRVLETALICANQPMPLRDMRALFAEELGADTLRSMLDDLRRDWEGRGVELVTNGRHPDDAEGLAVLELTEKPTARWTVIPY